MVVGGERSAGGVGDDGTVRCADGVGSTEGSGGGCNGLVGGAYNLPGGGAVDGARRDGGRLCVVSDGGV